MGSDRANPGVPGERGERERLLACARQYVNENGLVPPLGLMELRAHARNAVVSECTDPAHESFLAVLIANETWRATVAAVPCSRRVLLLPQCLRTRKTCAAKMDEFGLLCEGCGRCPLGGLQDEAEQLGYAVLIAEGTTVVQKLIEQGAADAVIGVGCIESLEKSFPAMARNAVPGLAIPLLRNGCDNTAVDLDWVRDAIRLRTETGAWLRCDVERLRAAVGSWFSAGELRPLLAGGGNDTERIALEWVAASGKRWRPLLVAGVYEALTGRAVAFPEKVRKLAVAVECFHKASLIHDDIEDQDEVRDGTETLHRRYGVPVALNAGDFLLGEGYRLIAACGASAEDTARMLQVAAEGHRELCLGQGQELCWTRAPSPLTVADVLDIFRRKTAPAFEVALRLGAIAAGTNGALCAVLKDFSARLGTAYQIRDDLDELAALRREPEGGAGPRLAPSILLALALERASTSGRAELEACLRAAGGGATLPAAARRALSDGGIESAARSLYEDYREQTYAALRPVRDVALKSLLHRVTGRILPAA